MPLFNLDHEEPKGNLNNSRISGFQCLLYTNFIMLKKYRVDEVSKKMRISSDLLYRYIRGDKRFPIDRFLDYLKATEDLDYLKYLAREVGCNLILKVKSEKVAKELQEIGRLLTSCVDDDLKGGKK